MTSEGQASESQAQVSEGQASESQASGSRAAPFARPASLAPLADLDRRVVPVVAMRLDRLLPGRRAPGRLVLGRTERRILGALALVLLACAVALVLVGG